MGKTGDVSKREPTFADILKDVEREAAKPKPPPAFHGPGRTPDGALVAPDGRYFREASWNVAPSQAAQLVAEEDVVVAYDECGCGGFCGYEWLSAEEIARLRGAGNPTLKSRKHHPAGSMSDWRDESGRPLLLIEGAVRWARLLDDR